MYDSEEECTLVNMGKPSDRSRTSSSVRLWKSYSLSCAPGHRLATYQRSNVRKTQNTHHEFFRVIKYHTSSLPHYAEDHKVLKSVKLTRFATLMEDSATVVRTLHLKGTDQVGTLFLLKELFETDSGTFNFTGLGGKNFIMTKRMITPAPLPPPKDCNLDGKRNEVEVT